MFSLFGITFFGARAMKDVLDDAELRNSSANGGMNFYASKTGLRDVRTNRKVIISHDGNMIDVKTGRKIGPISNKPEKDWRFKQRFIKGMCVTYDLAEMARERGKKYYEYSPCSYAETETDRKIIINIHSILFNGRYSYENEVRDLKTHELIRIEHIHPDTLTLSFREWNYFIETGHWD